MSAHNLRNIKYVAKATQADLGEELGNLIIFTDTQLVEFHFTESLTPPLPFDLTKLKYFLVSINSHHNENATLNEVIFHFLDALKSESVNKFDKFHHVFWMSARNVEVLVAILKSILNLKMTMEHNFKKYTNIDISQSGKQEQIIINKSLSMNSLKIQQPKKLISMMDILSNIGVQAENAISNTYSKFSQNSSAMSIQTNISNNFRTNPKYLEARKFSFCDLEALKSNPSINEQINLKRKLFFNGCSEEARQMVWTYLLRVDEDMEKKFEKFEELDKSLKLILDNGLEEDSTLSKSFDIIDADFVRTDPTSSYFQSESNREMLRRLLRMHCLFCEDSMYIQGMNDMMAIMMYTFMPECDSAAQTSNLHSEVTTFFAFESFLSRFVKKFLELDGVQLRIAFSHTAFILQDLSPSVFNHLNQIGCDFSILLLPWLMMAFKRLYSTYTDTIRLWDSLICNYHLENAKNVECTNLTLALSAIILSFLDPWIMKSNTMCDVVDQIKHQQHIGLLPDELVLMCAEFYDNQWSKGVESSLFTLLFLSLPK